MGADSSALIWGMFTGFSGCEFPDTGGEWGETIKTLLLDKRITLMY